MIPEIFGNTNVHFVWFCCSMPHIKFSICCTFTPCQSITKNGHKCIKKRFNVIIKVVGEFSLLLKVKTVKMLKPLKLSKLLKLPKLLKFAKLSKLPKPASGTGKEGCSVLLKSAHQSVDGMWHLLEYTRVHDVVFSGAAAAPAGALGSGDNPVGFDQRV